jgi:hypothetical protein
MIDRRSAIPNRGFARVLIGTRFGGILLLVLPFFAAVFASGALTGLLATHLSWTGGAHFATIERVSMWNGQSKSHSAPNPHATVSDDYVEILLRVIDENQSVRGSQRH